MFWVTEKFLTIVRRDTEIDSDIFLGGGYMRGFVSEINVIKSDNLFNGRSSKLIFVMYVNHIEVINKNMEWVLSVAPPFWHQATPCGANTQRKRLTNTEHFWRH